MGVKTVSWRWERWRLRARHGGVALLLPLPCALAEALPVLVLYLPRDSWRP